MIGKPEARDRWDLVARRTDRADGNDPCSGRGVARAKMSAGRGAAWWEKDATC